MDLIEEVKARHYLPAPKMRRAIREAAGVSQRAAGGHIGVTPQAVSYWESGAREPRGENLVKYAALLRQLAEVSS